MEKTAKKVKQKPKMKIRRMILTKKRRRKIIALMKFSEHATSLFKVNKRGGLLLDIPLTLKGKVYPRMVIMKRPKMRTKRSELVSCDT